MCGRPEKGSCWVSISPPSPPSTRFGRSHSLSNKPATIAGFVVSGPRDEVCDDICAFTSADNSSTKAYSELHHYRIFLAETGCHEVFAESFSAAQPIVPADA